MKKLFNITLLFLALFAGITNSTYSQYQPSFNGNPQWFTYSWFEISYNTQYQFAGDTIINDTTYKKLTNFPTNNVGSYFQMDLVREDTINRTIYQRLNSTDFIIYDFNLNVGDTFHYVNPQWINVTFNLVLDSITDTVYNSFGQYMEINLFPKKVFYFHDAENIMDNNIIWIESIGSLAGPLYSFRDWQGGNEGETLLCHYDENETRDFHYIYNFEQNPCEGFVGIDEPDKAETVTVFPNPISKGKLNIDGQNIKSIKIFGSFGNVVPCLVLKSGNRFEISIENEPTGVYFILVTFGNNESTIKKIIKQ
jgi:hypothetical protein